MAAPINNATSGQESPSETLPESSQLEQQNKKIQEMMSMIQKLQKDTFEMESETAQLESTLWLVKPDTQRAARYGTLVQKIGFSKVVSFDIPLIAPFGPPRLTPSNRSKKTETLLRLKQGEKIIGLGCSTLLELFCDSLISRFLECLKDRKLNMSEKLVLLLQDGSRQEGQRKDVAWTYFSNILSALGTIYTCIRSQNNGWRSPICFNNEVLTPFLAQQALSQTISQLSVNEKLIDFPRSENGTHFIETVQLLQEIVYQEMHRLAYPITPSPDFTGHFRRLKCRLQMLKHLLINVENLFPKGCKPSNQYCSLLEEDKRDFLAFCEALEQGMSKVAEGSTPTPTQLQELYQIISKISSQTIEIKLIKQLSLDIDTDKVVAQDPEALKMAFWLHLQWLFLGMRDSLLFDTLTVLVRELIHVSEVSKEDLDACIVNLIELSRSVVETSVPAIEQLITNSLARTDLDPMQKMQLLTLKQVWNADFNYLRDFAKQMLQVLEERRKRCRGTDSIWERVLALRDVIVFATSDAQVISKAINEELIKIKESFVGLRELDPLVKPLFDELLSLNEFHREAILSSLGGIESLLGRYFEKAQQDAVLEKATAAIAQAAKQSQADQIANELIAADSVKKATSKHKSVAASKLKPPVPQAPKAKSLVPQVLKSVEARVIEPPKLPEVAPKLEQLLSLSESLNHIQKAAESLKKKSLIGNGTPLRQQWRDAQLTNLTTWSLRLEETTACDTFACATIFSQTDLMRRMIEATLEVALAHYPLSATIPDVGHQLHMLVQMIVNKQDSTELPESVRTVVWQLRSIPYELSQANRCVNYLHSTHSKMNALPVPAQNLVKYLHLVETESRTKTPNEVIQKALQRTHTDRLHKSLYFVQKLLEVLNDPTKEIVGEIPSHFNDEELFVSEKLVRSSSKEFLQEDIAVAVGEETPLKPIRNREEALNALETALAWISLRIVSPVEGRIDAARRTNERNLALKNASLYLHHLQEKWLKNSLQPPYDMLSSEWDMLQRAHKEITIAALYHGSYYKGPLHVVEEQDLRFVNNPCRLMSVLKQFPMNGKKLPHLDAWMGSVHQVLCYPAPRREDERQQPMTKMLRGKLADVEKLATKKRDLLPGFSVVGSGKEAHSYEDLMKLLHETLDTDEKEKTYPALAALIQTLHGGMPLKRSLLQSGL